MYDGGSGTVKNSLLNKCKCKRNTPRNTCLDLQFTMVSLDSEVMHFLFVSIKHVGILGHVERQ